MVAYSTYTYTPECPVCEYRYDLCDSDPDEFVTYWGENEPLVHECPNCESKLEIEEVVDRFWNVTIRERKEVP